MTLRPDSITVVGWLLIVFGVFGVLGILLMAALWTSPIMQQVLTQVHARIPAQVAVGVTGMIVRPTCGIAFLLRQNWARFVYVGWPLIAFAYAIITNPYTQLLLIPSLVLTLVIVHFLFRPVATQYFTAKETHTT
ncbi:MAG: hypothetical protein WBR29_00645 [Gammaproteobacteria bacterium]